MFKYSVQLCTENYRATFCQRKLAENDRATNELVESVRTATLQNNFGSKDKPHTSTFVELFRK